MSEYVIHEENIGGLILKVIADEDRDSPRSWGNDATVMVCDHRRYNLGDDDAHSQAAADIRASRDYRPSWEEDEGKALDFSEGPDLYQAIQLCSDIVYLPLYLYDHSGITMSTGRFSCPWDSGQVGFIYMTKAKALEATMSKGTLFTAALKAKAFAYLELDVSVYDQYLTGDVWGYVVETHDGEQLDALWGCYGDDYTIEEGRKAARDLIEANPEYAVEPDEEEED